VDVYGGPNFDGWHHSFDVGSYTSVDLEHAGVKCDDISSVEVVGVYCTFTGFQYGDFNTAHSGFQVELKQGRHSASDIEAAGGKDNDISSFKVVQEQSPKAAQAVQEEGVVNGTEGFAALHAKGSGFSSWFR
jgi:hypothetical protein